MRYIKSSRKSKIVALKCSTESYTVMLASVIYHVGDPTALTPLATIVDTLLGVLWYFSGATNFWAS